MDVLTSSLETHEGKLMKRKENDLPQVLQSKIIFRDGWKT